MIRRNYISIESEPFFHAETHIAIPLAEMTTLADV
jgi:hypothetical protein